MELAKHGAFLFLMRLHALENVSEHAHGGNGVGAFVEHDALGTLAHGRVGDFRARRDSFLGQTLENLRRPDDRGVGGFADPENFFLNLGQALIAALDGQIAAGNHDAKRARSHSGENQVGQIVEGFASFDFQD